MRTRLGILGLGTLGQQLASHFDQLGLETSLYHYPESGLDSKVISLVLSNPRRKWRAGEDLVDFVVSIATPRIILITAEQEDIELVLNQLDAICTNGDKVVGIDLAVIDNLVFHNIEYISAPLEQLQDQTGFGTLII